MERPRSSSVVRFGTYEVSLQSGEVRKAGLRIRVQIRSYDDSALLLPIVVDGRSTEQSTLAFEHVGDKYFLSKVGTPAGVYTMKTPRAATMLAQVKVHGTLSSAGSD
jgi:hypothetical protein